MRYGVYMAPGEGAHDECVRAGLCADCMHARRGESDRGSIFYLCQRAASDPTFPKYPQLPMIRCSGYVSHRIDRTPQG